MAPQANATSANNQAIYRVNYIRPTDDKWAHFWKYYDFYRRKIITLADFSKLSTLSEKCLNECLEAVQEGAYND